MKDTQTVEASYKSGKAPSTQDRSKLSPKKFSSGSSFNLLPIPFSHSQSLSLGNEKFDWLVLFFLSVKYLFATCKTLYCINET